MRFRILAAFLAFMVLWPLSTVADVWTVDNLEMVHLKDRTKYAVSYTHLTLPTICSV